MGIVDNLSGYRKLAVNFTGVTNTTITLLMVPMLPGDQSAAAVACRRAAGDWPTNDLTLETNTPPVALAGNPTFTNNVNYFDFDLRSVGQRREHAVESIGVRHQPGQHRQRHFARRWPHRAVCSAGELLRSGHV